MAGAGASALARASARASTLSLPSGHNAVASARKKLLRSSLEFPPQLPPLPLPANTPRAPASLALPTAADRERRVACGTGPWRARHYVRQALILGPRHRTQGSVGGDGTRRFGSTDARE